MSTGGRVRGLLLGSTEGSWAPASLSQRVTNTSFPSSPDTEVDAALFLQEAKLRPPKLKQRPPSGPRGPPAGGPVPAAPEVASRDGGTLRPSPGG